MKWVSAIACAVLLFMLWCCLAEAAYTDEKEGKK